jgi:hypothetical protein
MSIVTDLMTGGVGSIVDTVGKLASDLITTDAERLAAQNDAARIGLDRDKAFLGDTANARDTNVKIQESANASYLAKNVGYWLDLFIVGATFGLAYLIMFKAIPVENKEILFTAFGSLITLTFTVVNFHRSSTAKSQSKDNTIQVLAGNQSS